MRHAMQLSVLLPVLSLLLQRVSPCVCWRHAYKSFFFIISHQTMTFASQSYSSMSSILRFVDACLQPSTKMQAHMDTIHAVARGKKASNFGFVPCMLMVHACRGKKKLLFLINPLLPAIRLILARLFILS
jgi:hypothetical protein